MLSIRSFPQYADPSSASVQILKSSTETHWHALTAYSLYHRANGESSSEEVREFGPGLRLLYHVSGEPNRIARRHNGNWTEGTSRPGTFFLSSLLDQPGTSYHWSNAASTIYLVVNSDVCFKVASDLSPSDPVRLDFFEQNFQIDPLVGEMAHAFLRTIENDDTSSNLYVDALSVALIHHCLRRFGSLALSESVPTRMSKHQLQRTLDFIHDGLDQDLSLNEIAAYAGHSVTHFSRLFRQATGLSPYRYLIQCRVERARELLSEEKYTVAQVAQMVGFFDQSHLSRAFKRAYGIPPSAVRSQHGRNVHT